MTNRAASKVVVVSGGASGIGAATVRALVAEGATAVTIADVNEAAGRALANELDPRVSFARLDVTNEGSWKLLLESIGQRQGRLDSLINCAGISGGNATIEEIELSNWNNVLSINLTGLMLGCKHAVSIMKRFGNGGSIVNVASTLSSKVLAQKIAYCASKAALTHMTKAIALHCAKAGYRIRCNSVHPGAIDTPMNDELLPNFGHDRQAMLAEIGKFQALGRVADPAEVASAIVFLISDEAAFMTGSELLVDGGFMLL
jgi:NAD(P)-dependent dehydrogenase (short-subunit alcohol dehydrogenase family)